MCVSGTPEEIEKVHPPREVDNNTTEDSARTSKGKTKMEFAKGIMNELKRKYTFDTEEMKLLKLKVEYLEDQQRPHRYETPPMDDSPDHQVKSTSLIRLLNIKSKMCYTIFRIIKMSVVK